MSRKRRGANAVEFALTAPVLVAMLGGMLEFGMYLTQQHVVQAAVRDAARVGATTAVADGPVANAKARALAVLEDAGTPLSGLKIDAALVDDGGETFIDVSVSVNYTRIFPFAPTPANTKSRLSMRIEDQ